MRNLILAVLLVAGSAVYAQGTSDGETPANEGVCDDLMYATPGLFGLCVAFCEAQDCSPDWSREDPLELCRPSSARVLDNYRRRMQPGDPDMPCVGHPCPCWSQEELDGLRYPSPPFGSGCSTNEPYFNYWEVSSGYPYRAAVQASWFPAHPNPAPTCLLVDTCLLPGECLNVNRFMEITPEEFESCMADVRQSGIDRGFDHCWP